MSLESAMAALDGQKPMSEPTPHLDPNNATKVVNKADDGLTLDLKSDSLSTTKREAPLIPDLGKDAAAIKDVPRDPAKEEVKEDPKTPEQERAARSFAVLAKKEQIIQQQTRLLKDREVSLGDREAKVKTYENLKAQALENPMLALKELGITYDDLTKYVVSGKMPQGEGAKIDEVKRELESLRNQLADNDKREKEREVKAEQDNRQKILNDFRSEIVEHIKVNAEKYELCSLYPDEAREQVLNRIQKHHEESQQILSLDEACESIERELEVHATKLLGAKKVLAKVQPPPKPSAQPRTLSNEMTASAPSFLPAKTEKDRIARAMAALSR